MSRCGVVAVLGAPNAGKSTLVNALVGQKVAIVSAKAQTTRARLMGIALAGDAQIILADTPGIFAPKRRLDRAMVSRRLGRRRRTPMRSCWWSTRSSSAVMSSSRCWNRSPDRPERKLLVLNKVDAAVKEPLLALAQDLTGKVGFDEVFYVSALTGDGVAELKQRLAELMPEGPWHYPEDQVSDASERLLAGRRSPASSSTASSTTSCPTTARCAPRATPCARTARSRSTSRSSSAATARRRSCSASAAPGSRRSAKPRASELARTAGRAGPPVPARQGRRELGRKPRDLRGDRAGLGAVKSQS